MSANFARRINNKYHKPKGKNYSFSSFKGPQDSAIGDLLSPKTIDYSTIATRFGDMINDSKRQVKETADCYSPYRARLKTLDDRFDGSLNYKYSIETPLATVNDYKTIDPNIKVSTQFDSHSTAANTGVVLTSIVQDNEILREELASLRKLFEKEKTRALYAEQRAKDLLENEKGFSHHVSELSAKLNQLANDNAQQARSNEEFTSKVREKLCIYINLCKQYSSKLFSIAGLLQNMSKCESQSMMLSDMVGTLQKFQSVLENQSLVSNILDNDDETEKEQPERKQGLTRQNNHQPNSSPDSKLEPPGKLNSNLVEIIQTLEIKIEELNAENARLKAEAKLASKSTSTKYEDQIENLLYKLKKYKANRTELKAQLNELQDCIEKQNEKIQSLNNTNGEIKKKLRDSSRNQTALEEEISSTKKKLQTVEKLTDKVASLQEELLESKNEYKKSCQLASSKVAQLKERYNGKILEKDEEIKSKQVKIDYLESLLTKQMNTKIVVNKERKQSNPIEKKEKNEKFQIPLPQQTYKVKTKSTTINMSSIAEKSIEESRRVPSNQILILPTESTGKEERYKKYFEKNTETEELDKAMKNIEKITTLSPKRKNRKGEGDREFRVAPNRFPVEMISDKDDVEMSIQSIYAKKLMTEQNHENSEGEKSEHLENTEDNEEDGEIHEDELRADLDALSGNRNGKRNRVGVALIDAEEDETVEEEKLQKDYNLIDKSNPLHRYLDTENTKVDKYLNYEPKTYSYLVTGKSEPSIKQEINEIDSEILNLQKKLKLMLNHD